MLGEKKEVGFLPVRISGAHVQNALGQHEFWPSEEEDNPYMCIV